MIDIEFTRVHLEIVKSEKLPAGGDEIARIVKLYGLHTQPQEALWVVAYGKNGHLYRIVEIARGFHDRVTVDISAVMTAVLACGAPNFAIAHNHPSMWALPSTSDNTLTESVMASANACGLVFEDHVIVEPGGAHYSYADQGLFLGVKASRPKAASRRSKR